MTEVQIDILEIKQTLNEMKKNIAKIENNLRDSYFDDKILEMQYGNNENYRQRQLIDDAMNDFLKMKNQCKNNHIIQEYCDSALADLHEQYIELSLEDDDDK